ncbi:hypothetical protein MRP26_28140 [Bacillus sp. CCB-MMP212]|uniref:hypothetical protein n=1 Tax=Bacillus sp. CCB-MMP212 TaxID=2928002 RepID=UPI001F607C29|nr:hypothetical protein [Bacillus sp. CCB-MMP212]MCI4252766.1 hypothetical protein [Bacillus sp. CCB-MMP212]
MRKLFSGKRCDLNHNFAILARLWFFLFAAKIWFQLYNIVTRRVEWVFCST